MVVSSPSNLKHLREEVHISQEALARDIKISLATYRRAEWGERIKYSTGKRILDALNAHRQANQLPPLTLDDLGLTLE